MTARRGTLASGRGFTLIELLIVIAIIALLASLVAPKLFQKLGSSKVKAAKTQIQMIVAALDAFRLDVDRYPSEQEGLEALWNKPAELTQWDGPYLPKPVIQDPWGHPYVYKSPGDQGHPYELVSYGADGQSGGKDENADLSAWE